MTNVLWDSWHSMARNIKPFLPGIFTGQNDVYTTFSKPNIKGDTPTYWMRASEVYFLRAEAALVWGGEFGNADELYKQGIGMSFQENGVTASVDDYMNSGNVPIKHEFGGSYSCHFFRPSCRCGTFEGSREEKIGEDLYPEVACALSQRSRGLDGVEKNWLSRLESGDGKQRFVPRSHH